jgi:spermidine synthase
VLERDHWFTEIAEKEGSAFSLRIRAKLHEERTPYQTIEIYETTGFGNLMVIDGCTMVSARDNFLYHEMMAHPALFTHEHPRRICIVGGGDCGTLREVLKHAEVQEVTQIDIDERVTRLAEQYFPELTEANGDPRAKLLFDDGILWVRQAEPASVDIVIVDSTDPVGPAEGLFGDEFYADCFKALGTGGLFVQQSESPLYHLGILRAMYAAMRKAGFADVKTLFFPQAIYPSGWWSATMARKGRMIDGFREHAAETRSFQTRYYNGDIHRAALAQPEFFRQAVSSQTE